MHSDYWFYLQVDSTLEEDRRQKHVSFDSSSLMRSQTLATMDEASFQRMAAAIASQNMASSPSKSSERLIDGRKTPDLELYSQIFPPDLARQIMMGKATFVIFFSVPKGPRSLLVCNNVIRHVITYYAHKKAHKNGQCNALAFFVIMYYFPYTIYFSFHEKYMDSMYPLRSCPYFFSHPILVH